MMQKVKTDIEAAIKQTDVLTAVALAAALSIALTVGFSWMSTPFIGLVIGLGCITYSILFTRKSMDSTLEIILKPDTKLSPNRADAIQRGLTYLRFGLLGLVVLLLFTAYGASKAVGWTDVPGIVGLPIVASLIIACMANDVIVEVKEN